MTKKGLFAVLATIIFACLTQSCTYRLDQASIPPTLHSINIGYFENNAPFVVNNLSQNFTEALRDRVRSQTPLHVVTGEADATMTGAIIGYAIAPVSVQATGTTNTAPPIASASRLTVTVTVKYNITSSAVSAADKRNNFEQQFSRFADFKGDIGNQEQALLTTIIKQLVDDIFNRAFANW